MTYPLSGRPLVGRTALVTGVSRTNGIGFAIARHLAELGANLALHALPGYDRVQYGTPHDDFARVQTALRDVTPHVQTVEADLFDPEAPGRVVDAACAAFGHLDILVPNHAYSVDDTIFTLTAERVDRHLLVNVRATLLLIQAFARQHDGRPGGRVVLLTSGQDRGAMPWVVSYDASKAALSGVTATLSHDLIRRGITVNTVDPGATDTGYADAKLYAQVAAASPQGRWGTPDDAARLVAWLCTDDARWVTGQVIHSTGGA